MPYLEPLPCGVCGDPEAMADDPCHECDRPCCDDCAASYNHEHGLVFCCECCEKIGVGDGEWTDEDEADASRHPLIGPPAGGIDGDAQEAR